LSCDFLDNGESSTHCFERFLITLPDLLNGVLGGDNELCRPDIDGLSFDLGDKRQEISPMLKHIGQTPVEDGHVIADDHILSLVAIPPLVKGLEIGVGVQPIGCCSLSRSGSTPEPDPTNAVELWGTDHKIFCDRFEGLIMPESEFGIDVFNISYNKI